MDSNTVYFVVIGAFAMCVMIMRRAKETMCIGAKPNKPFISETPNS